MGELGACAVPGLSGLLRAARATQCSAVQCSATQCSAVAGGVAETLGGGWHGCTGFREIWCTVLKKRKVGRPKIQPKIPEGIRSITTYFRANK